MLDFLRAIAVLLVFVNHLLDVSHVDGFGWLIQRLGWMGVMLFFVHTSLVLMFSLERSSASASGRSLLTYFLVRRAFRIYPLSMVVVLAVVAFQIPVAQATWKLEPATLPTLTANLLLVQNLVYAPNVLGPLWSLPLELQMYLLLPFLFWAVDGGKRWRVAVALLVGSVGLAYIQPLVSNRANLMQFAPCFMGGVLAYCLSRRRGAAWPFWSWVLALSGAMLAFLAAAATQGDGNPMILSWALSVGVGCLIPSFRETRSVVVRRLSATIAKYSYGIYLTHMIALWLAFVPLGGQPLAVRVFVGTVLTAVFSVLSYHLVEAPGISAGTRVAARFLRRGLSAVSIERVDKRVALTV